ncbi:hypothetical protein ACHQM5_008706 [Ranunculus cassubicifolius]
MAFHIPLQLQWLPFQQEVVLHYPLSFLFITFFSFVFVIFWLTGVLAKEKLNLPPSPPKIPIIGHLHLLGTLPHRSLQSLSKKYGPLMLLQLGQIPTLVVQSADMAKEVMKTHDIIFSNRPSITASKVFLCDGKDISFAPYGEHWRQMRKLCILDLLSIKRVQSFKSVREEEIVDMVDQIRKSSSSGKEVNLSELILSVTSNIITRIGLGRRLEKIEHAKLAKESMILFGHSTVEDMFPSLKWIDVLTGLDRRMKTTSKAMHQFIDEAIEEHDIARKDNNRQADRKDFIDLLLDYKNDSALAGVSFTREHLRGVIMNMFVAGSDTTYATLEWAMAELVNHKNVMKKVQQEVRRVVGRKRGVDESDINQMDYLNCVIKETLRLHPPVVLSIPRESSSSTTIEGYTIPAKTRVLINLWAIAKDPKMWDKPEEFIPERFQNNPVDFRGQDFEYIPFGAGRRGCPGISFAIKSVESVLANLLHWFDWELPGGHDKKDMNMSEVFGLSVSLKSPLHLVPLDQTS